MKGSFESLAVEVVVTIQRVTDPGYRRTGKIIVKFKLSEGSRPLSRSWGRKGTRVRETRDVRVDGQNGRQHTQGPDPGRDGGEGSVTLSKVCPRVSVDSGRRSTRGTSSTSREIFVRNMM